MKESQLLKLDQAVQVLCDAAQVQSSAMISYLRNSRWQNANSILCEVTGTGLEIEMEENRKNSDSAIPINQPVGVSLRFGHIKYIFETRITGVGQDISDDGKERYTLALPDRIEVMQRRAYTRVPTPRAIDVRVTLWHRGYNDSHADAPSEDYWQASLVDLSAGGLMVSIKADSSQFFQQNQYLGLQFTPAFYQKPITLEGKINRLGQCDKTGNLNIAVEFLGLEASTEGREKMHRLISIVNTYAMQNKGLGVTDADQIAPTEITGSTDAVEAIDAAVDAIIHK